ncbi:NAD(P)-binding protein [Ideonella dechloratans]|uniref:NAD(P)-binding protein n=2 Tax=Ideonella dechloratans TaxID=36863 RepID=A0A643F3S5_IDEDE|nr:NAD(P)-binding protein [Ideonella dechloratans]
MERQYASKTMHSGAKLTKLLAMKCPELSPMNPRAAVVGAGLAGASCARWLADAGWQVQVFDKARGPGGRLATRRMVWTTPDGQERVTWLDHGAADFGARGPAFQRALLRAQAEGWCRRWQPRPSSPLAEVTPRWLGQAGMPDWCRGLLDGLNARWSCPVDTLGRGLHGWWLESGGQRVAEGLDAVVLALPPAQAAPLLAPWRPDWAGAAAAVPMLPCWTVMGVSSELAAEVPGGALACPPTGPLARVLRQDARPGREQRVGEAHWVLQATPTWSQLHLEEPPEVVLPALQAALAEWLGEPVLWRSAVAHRWRYAVPALPPAGASHWWDGELALGVCGDFLGGAQLPAGVEPVERAWSSARDLAGALQTSVVEVLA